MHTCFAVMSHLLIDEVALHVIAAFLTDLLLLHPLNLLVLLALCKLLLLELLPHKALVTRLCLGVNTFLAIL